MTSEADGFDVRGNTLLSTAQLRQALGDAPMRLELLAIQSAAQRVQQAYRAAGYGAVVVVVPAQTLQGDRVRLEVIEGKLRQAQVTGQREFSRANVLASLPSLQLGRTPRLLDLDSELLMANENPAKQVRVVFQPGELRGDVEALVVVEEQAVSRIHAVLDNSGNAQTGRYRLTASYQNANVADRDIVFGLRAATSPTDPASVAVVGSTLRVPLYGAKVFLEGSVLSSNTRSAASATPAGDLRFSGKGRALGAQLVWTLASASTSKRQMSLGLDARRYRNDCSLGEFGAAGCGTAVSSVDVLPLTLSYSLQAPGSFVATARWVGNLPLGSAGRDADFDASRPGADSHYRLLRWNLSGQQRAGGDWGLAWRMDGQWTGRPLVFAEQFGAGGAQSVRGYPERAISADSGAAASMELRRPLAFGQEGWFAEGALSTFVEAAVVANRAGTQCAPGRTQCQLWGAGAGLSSRPWPGTYWRIDLARAGSDIATTARGDWRLHFSISHSL